MICPYDVFRCNKREHNKKQFMRRSYSYIENDFENEEMLRLIQSFIRPGVAKGTSSIE